MLVMLGSIAIIRMLPQTDCAMPTHIRHAHDLPSSAALPWGKVATAAHGTKVANASNATVEVVAEHASSNKTLKNATHHKSGLHQTRPEHRTSVHSTHTKHSLHRIKHRRVQHYPRHKTQHHTKGTRQLLVQVNNTDAHNTTDWTEYYGHMYDYDDEFYEDYGAIDADVGNSIDDAYSQLPPVLASPGAAPSIVNVFLYPNVPHNNEHSSALQTQNSEQNSSGYGGEDRGYEQALVVLVKEALADVSKYLSRLHELLTGQHGLQQLFALQAPLKNLLST